MAVFVYGQIEKKRRERVRRERKARLLRKKEKGRWKRIGQVRLR